MNVVKLIFIKYLKVYFNNEIFLKENCLRLIIQISFEKHIMR